MAALANSFTGASVRRGRTAARGAARGGAVRVQAAARDNWFPGSVIPSHLDGSLPGDFGFDPLRLGCDPEDLKWYREAELQHARWAMAATAGILAAEIAHPETFWYSAASTVDLPFDILGLVATQFLLMHWVEVRRWRDFQAPGSVNKDPVFSGNSLPDHEPGYPGGIFNPLGFGGDDLAELKLKEIKNGRVAMLAFVGYVMQAQVTGLGPIACWKQHLADPWGTSVTSKFIITPTTSIAPPCAIPPVTTFQGIDIPTPCFLQGLWP